MVDKIYLLESYRWYEYNDDGYLIHEYNKCGYHKYYNYDENNNITRIYDTEGYNLIIDDCNKPNELLLIMDDMYNTIDYDDNGNIIHAVCDKRKEDEVWIKYDDNQNRIYEYYADGYSVSYEYDNRGLNTILTDSDGYKIFYKYDINGNLIHTLTSDNVESFYNYNKYGLLVHKSVILNL